MAWWPWFSKQAPVTTSNSSGLRDNPDYSLCSMCGGTGWAYAMQERSEGRSLVYIPCPQCHAGKFVKP